MSVAHDEPILIAEELDDAPEAELEILVDDNRGNPARGMAIAVGLSIPMWAGIIYAVRAAIGGL